ncbi:hypothetical protein CsSME_00051053 [Camellia sinensis var. sinensis]
MRGPPIVTTRIQIIVHHQSRLNLPCSSHHLSSWPLEPVALGLVLWPLALINLTSQTIPKTQGSCRPSSIGTMFPWGFLS